MFAMSPGWDLPLWSVCTYKVALVCQSKLVEENVCSAVCMGVGLGRVVREVR
jgi:hypothetical protein